MTLLALDRRFANVSHFYSTTPRTSRLESTAADDLDHGIGLLDVGTIKP